MTIYTFVNELYYQKIRKVFRQIHLCTILIQVTSTIFIDNMPTYPSFKEKYFMLASKFSIFYHVV